MVMIFKKNKSIKRSLKGTTERPRLNVFKSNTSIYCQLIDDEKNKILTSFSSRELNKDKKNCNIETAKKTGEGMGQKILDLNIKKISFYRNGYLYHGKISAVAEGIRAKGIIF